ESIEFLREMQDHAIIVASNSPYRKLINSGIKPHLVVTADPMRPTLAGFQNVSLEGVPLACPYSAYPEIVRRFSGSEGWKMTASASRPLQHYSRGEEDFGRTGKQEHLVLLRC
ncbi:MAG: DUF115 domain-containing protein, partial [Proteobacteria bacterium]|nr:DUF115 domain-containing protein [Pseudomonadota bacterium]